MTTELALIDPNLLALLRGSLGKHGELAPFVREIFLIECHIAGTGYRDLANVEPTLSVGDLLILRREPDNSVDKLAVKILDEHGHFLGYVPQVKNEAIARLMDAGKILFGKLESKSRRSSWLKIEARILMRDV